MPSFSGRFFRILPLAGFLWATLAFPAAQNGNSASVRGSVTDTSTAVIPGASVTISNPVSGCRQISSNNAFNAAGNF